MLVSHKYKFCYVHVCKTGGQALMLGLKPFIERKRHVDNMHFNWAWHNENIKRATKDYYKFGFVRNPYTRVASGYYFKQPRWHKKGLRTFKDYVMEFKNTDMNAPQRQTKLLGIRWPASWYLKETEVEMYKYEDFNSELERLRKKLGIPHLNVMRHNVTKTRPNKPYIEMYDDEMIQVVNDYFKKDFELFGYEMINV